jgi:hypothetical protein
MPYTLKNKETIAALADGFFCAMIKNPNIVIGPKTSPGDLKALVALAVAAAEEMAGLCDRYGPMESDGGPFNVPAYDRPPSHCPDCGSGEVRVRAFQCKQCGRTVGNGSAHLGASKPREGAEPKSGPRRTPPDQEAEQA